MIDLKPALTREQLDARILRDLQQGARSQVKTALHALLPARLLTIVLEQSDISESLSVGELTKAMRQKLVETLKALPLTVSGARGVEEAVVTRGGVSVKDVNASTMESKRVKGLYFAGEVLDIDATTGGYNLQIAWSTGALAGDSIGK
jgi:predicted Rossmann fold flavoprotein